jgi:GH24 family phage-related lysozyme (muramidase)
MGKYESQVKNKIERPLSQREFDALTVFTYNMRGGLRNAQKLVKAVNDKANVDILQQTWYIYSNSINPSMHRGLLNRRMDEFEIIRYGDYRRTH